MTVILKYLTGDTARIECVEAIRLVGKTTVELNTYGNGPVTHRRIDTFEVIYGTDRRERAETLIDADDSVFPSDLSGYTAGDAARALIAHWNTCAPPLDNHTKASDIGDVIEVLTRWQSQVAAGTFTGGK